MKLSIWGSGGGEGYPALFCGCENCKAAKKAGGKNLRTLSQCCIDDELLINLPADTHTHVLKNNCSLYEIEHILITHSHGDHFVPNLLNLRGGVAAHNLKAEELKVYGTVATKTLFDDIFNVLPIGEQIKSSIVFPTIKPYEDFHVGRYTVTALPAYHFLDVGAYNYIISDEKSSLLYFVDTGYPREEVLSFLEKRGEVFDCVTMDATMGKEPIGFYPYHMNFEENILLKNELFSRGVINKSTRVIAMHITHNHGMLHEDIEKRFKGEDIDVAYDGMSVEF